MSQNYWYPPGSSSAVNNPSVAPNGGPAAAQSTLVAGIDDMGDQRPMHVDNSGNLDVNVLSAPPVTGTVTANQGAPNSAANKWPVSITDGTNTASVSAANALKVDGSSVTQPISASSLPLPTGASTSVLQTSGNTSLASIDSHVPQLTLVGSALKVDGSAVTQPVSAVNLPLPTGAATSALQTSLNNKSASAFINVPFDETVITYVGATTNVSTVTYKLAGVTQNILTMMYDGSNRLVDVLKS